MLDIGWQELLIISAVLAVLYLIFTMLPRLARWLGKSISSYWMSLKEGKDEAKSTVAETKGAVGVDEVESKVADIRDATGTKKVLSGKKGSASTSPGAAARKKRK